MKKVLLVFVALLLLAGAAAAWYFFARQTKPNEAQGDSVPAETQWLTYTNETYGFRLEYPSDWRVAEFSDGAFPAINVYKPETTEGLDLPLIHHSNATQVSVFPNGVPTEGIIGQSQPSTLTFKPGGALATDFVLADGSRWATYSRFNRAPAGWDQSGFVWGAVKLDDLTIDCLVDGVELPTDQCAPPLPDGAVLLRHANVSRQDRADVERILSSLTFTQPTKSTTDSQAPVLTTPQPDEVVSSPLQVSGEAYGTWYFEASFPIELRDANNNLVTQAIAQAQSDWMVEDFVAFEAMLTFGQPQTPAGRLILKKDNPSGLPEFDQQVEIPVRFQP